MKHKIFFIFSFLWVFGNHLCCFAQSYSDFSIKEKYDRLHDESVLVTHVLDTQEFKLRIFLGSIFFNNINYSSKVKVYDSDGWRITYPYFGNNEISKARQYKNALSNNHIAVPLMELQISKNSKHFHGLGIGYGKKENIDFDGPFMFDYMTIKELHLFYQYYYCPFNNSNLPFIKNIYLGIKALYALKNMDFTGISEGNYDFKTHYLEKNHIGLFQLTAGYLSSGKVKIDLGGNFNLIGLTFGKYDYSYVVDNTGFIFINIRTEDNYSKLFYFENFFYNIEFKIGFGI